jgi:hypothetical protein
VRSILLAGGAGWIMGLLGAGTLGDRRDGVKVELLIRAGNDLRKSFLGGMVKVVKVKRVESIRNKADGDRR